MKYPYKTLPPIYLTPKQNERFKEFVEILEDMAKKNKLGAIIAQAYPCDHTQVKFESPKIDFAILPSYKAKKIIKIIRQSPSGKIRRRYLFKNDDKLESFYKKWVKEKRK